MSCQVQDTSKNSNLFEVEFGGVPGESVLQIYFQSTECGEWGGHEEYITISKKTEKEYQLVYEKFKADCDSMVQQFDGIGLVLKPLNTLFEKKEFVLGENDKQTILNFSIGMVASKFEHNFIDHSGPVFSICNSDSTFYIWKYGGDSDRYDKLIKSLKLEP